MSFENTYVILLASGIGKRANTRDGLPKQLWRINKKPLFLYSLFTFKKFFDDKNIIITYPEGYFDVFKKILSYYKCNCRLILGGSRRQDSVKNAINSIMQSEGIVLIHDTARPLITKDLILRVLDGAKKYKACIPVIPCNDTVKMVKNSFVESTIDREYLRFSQTPQGFSLDILKNAIKSSIASEEYTDEANLLEKLGYKVFTVMGEKFNLKLTFPEDFTIINKLIYERKSWNWD